MADASVLSSSMIRKGDIYYDVHSMLGTGCFGQVFSGLYRDGTTYMKVAVKKVVIREDPLCDTRREVLSMQNFSHLNVIHLLGVEEDAVDSLYERYMYLALEWCCGTLKDYISGHLQITLPDFEWEYGNVPTKILRETTKGVKYIHKEGFVHKDLKTDNILIGLEDNGRYRIKLADFGLVRRLDRGLVDPDSSYTGNASHRAPERGTGYGTTSMDIFGLGIIFYEVLTRGSHPFGLADKEKRANIEAGKFSLKPLVDSEQYEAVDLIGKMINHTPSERPTAKQVFKHPLLWTKYHKDIFIGQTCRDIQVPAVELHPNWVSRLNKWAENFNTEDAAALDMDLSIYKESPVPLKSLTEAFNKVVTGRLSRSHVFRLFEKNVPCFAFFAWLTNNSLKYHQYQQLVGSGVVAGKGGATIDLWQWIQERNPRHVQQTSSSLHQVVEFNDFDKLSQVLGEGIHDGIDSQDHKGRTPIHLAAELASPAIIELLADHGAKLDIADKEGFTPLHRAALRGQDDIVETLLQLKAPLEARDSESRTPLHCAAAKDRPSIVQLLLSAGALVNVPSEEDFLTPLHFAVLYGTEQNAVLLINAGADIKAPSDYKETALHMAVCRQRVSPAFIRFLLEKGADVNIQDKFGITPLHRAAQKQTASIVEILLSKTTEVNKADEDGKTALHYAAQAIRRENEKLLINAGAVANTV